MMQQSMQRWSPLVSMIALVGCVACAQTHPPMPPPTAADILAHAQQAPLKDTSFTVQAAFNLGGERGHTAATLSGQGVLTPHPQRVDLHYTSSGLGQDGTAEVITDVAALVYIKTPGSPVWSTHPASQAGYLNRGDFLRYDQLQQVTLIGAETINGILTWHLRTIPPENALAPTQITGNLISSEDLWLRQRDDYPVKIAISASGEASVPDANGQQTLVRQTLDLTLAFTAWDTGATITLPPASQVAPSN